MDHSPGPIITEKFLITASVYFLYLNNDGNENDINSVHFNVRVIYIMKENDGGVNSTKYIVRTFINVTMYSEYNKNMIKKEIIYRGSLNNTKYTCGNKCCK
jgi:hypothetical protein